GIQLVSLAHLFGRLLRFVARLEGAEADAVHGVAAHLHRREIGLVAAAGEAGADAVRLALVRGGEDLDHHRALGNGGLGRPRRSLRRPLRRLLSALPPPLRRRLVRGGLGGLGGGLVGAPCLGVRLGRRLVPRRRYRRLGSGLAAAEVLQQGGVGRGLRGRGLLFLAVLVAGVEELQLLQVLPLLRRRGRRVADDLLLGGARRALAADPHAGEERREQADQEDDEGDDHLTVGQR